MNKYQESLNKLKNEPVYYESDDGASKLEDVFPEEISILQKLVDKETPVKPYFVDTRFRQKGRKYGEFVTVEKCYQCPNCKLHIFYDCEDYRCHHCGQKLDWSDENGK